MRLKHLTAASLAALSLSGCATTGGTAPGAAAPAAPAPMRADVNPGYKAGGTNIPTAPTPSLAQVLARTPTGSVQKVAEGEDRLRVPAMQEAALAYGARGGLAHATREVNRTLEARSRELTGTYNFQKLMIQGPNGVMVVPPVISEALDTWESFDAGKTLRTADSVYEIIEQSTFASVAPMWQTYLIADYAEAETPPNALLPRDAEERKRWNGWVAEGWRSGEKQAQEAFQANLNRLQRDYTGMVRYRTLLEEKRVSPPVIAEGNLGVTGTGQDMRVNDRAIRITQDPALVVNPRGWEASPTAKAADGTDAGPAPKPAGAAAPKPKAERAKPRAQSRWHAQKPSRTAAAPRSKPKPAATPAKRVDAPTSGGGGRF